MQEADHMQGYWTVMASDLQRDGMGLELHANGSSKYLAEVFYSDETGKLSISLFEKDLPLPVIEGFIAMAKVA
jgi:hypothetical protein